MTTRPYTGEPKGAYRPSEFMIRYGIGRTKLYELIGIGAVKARKLGSATVILHQDAEAWARSLPELGDEPLRAVANASEQATARTTRPVALGAALLRERTHVATP